MSISYPKEHFTPHKNLSVFIYICQSTRVYPPTSMISHDYLNYGDQNFYKSKPEMSSLSLYFSEFPHIIDTISFIFPFETLSFLYSHCFAPGSPSTTLPYFYFVVSSKDSMLGLFLFCFLLTLYYHPFFLFSCHLFGESEIYNLSTGFLQRSKIAL